MNTNSMSDDEIFAIVRTSFAKLLSLPEENISIDSRLNEDLNVDSMFLIESAMVLEDKFEIEILEDVMQKLLTIRQVVEFISEKLTAKSKKLATIK